MKTQAQINLVPNPSFEDTLPNPNWLGVLDQICANWITPGPWSTDYFNDINPFCPGCASNVHAPRTGLGFAGIYTYSGGFDGRDILTAKLIDTLLTSREYCVSFYVSKAKFTKYICNNIGASFTATPYLTSNSIVGGFPQVSNSISNTLSDTTNWVLISGSFIATGNEVYLTIGNFETDANSTIIVGNGFIDSSSYYFIDDVRVIECPTDTLSIPNVFTPNYDGINDLFEIKGLQRGDNVQIYNRWGTKVFENLNERAYWDGFTTSGEPCNTGVYFYTITLVSGETRKGYLQLLK